MKIANIKTFITYYKAIGFVTNKALSGISGNRSSYVAVKVK